MVWLITCQAPTVTALDDDDRKMLPAKPNAPKWVEGPANAIFDHCEVSYGNKSDDLEKDPSKWTTVRDSGGKTKIEEGLVMYFAGEHGKIYSWS